MPFKGFDEYIIYSVIGNIQAYIVTLVDNAAENAERIAELHKQMADMHQTILLLEKKGKASTGKLIAAKQRGSFRKPAHLITSKGGMSLRGKYFRYFSKSVGVYERPEGPRKIVLFTLVYMRDRKVHITLYCLVYLVLSWYDIERPEGPQQRVDP